MSTKTLRKRIALVAAAALGTGLLSVAPAHAIALTYTTTLDTAGSTTTPVAGSAVTISVKLAGTTKTADSVTDITNTAAIASKPTNSALALTGAAITSSVATNAVTWGTTTTEGANVLVTRALAASTAQAVGVIGTFTFTPDTAGYYTVSITPTVAAVTAGSDTIAAAAAITVGINVSGGSLVQAASGLGSATGTQAVGSQSAAAFWLPAASTTASRYIVTATGASLVGVFVGTADVANANTYTSTTNVVKNDGTSFQQGVTLPGSGTATAVTLDGAKVVDGVVAQFTSATAGTATVTVKSVNVTTGLLTTVGSVTVTYGATPVVSAGNSTAFLSAGQDCAAADDAAGVTLAKTAGVTLAAGDTTGAAICIAVKDQNNVAYNGAAISATVSGPGLITLATGNGNASTGTVRTASLTATAQAATNLARIGISADGSAGVGTITITAGDVIIATKKVTFYGAVTKYVATPVLIATANGIATRDAIVVCATDASGIAVPSATIYATSSDTTAAGVATSATTASTAVVEDVDGAGATLVLDPTAYVAAKAIGCAGFSVTGVSQTAKSSVVITFRDAAAAADATVSTTATVGLGGVSAASVALTTDKSSYTAGGKVVITLTYKDSAGRLVGAGPATGTLDAALVASANLPGDTLFATANNLKLGVATANVYAPYTSGTVTISGTTGQNATYLDSAARGVALSKSITITSASSATDAAIASLIAKINALAKLIAKIQKKLGVK